MTIMLKMMLILVLLSYCMFVIVTSADCWSSFFGGCHKSGGHCENFGIPPNNNCRCMYDRK